MSILKKQPSLAKEEKQKASVEFTAKNHELVKDTAERFGTTFGRFLNFMIEINLNLPVEVKKDLSSYCASKVQSIDEMLPSLGEYERADAIETRSHYQSLAYFFSEGAPTAKKEGVNMQRVYLQEGYLTCPKDWILLKDAISAPEDSLFAGVVEVRNSDFPHYVFFTNKRYGKDYTDEDENNVYDACVKANPKFKKIINQQVPPPDVPPTDPTYNEKSERFLASPTIGLFHIIRDDDPYFEAAIKPFGTYITKGE